jgi:hypothetical protein
MTSRTSGVGAAQPGSMLTTTSRLNTKAIRMDFMVVLSSLKR